MRVLIGLLSSLALCAAACGSGSDPADAGADAGPVDSGYAPDTNECGPVGGTPGACVLDTCASGRTTCVGAPCPYDCCQSGRVETCFVAVGDECDNIAITPCGDGTCSGAGRCVDGGPSGPGDAGG